MNSFLILLPFLLPRNSILLLSFLILTHHPNPCLVVLFSLLTGSLLFLLLATRPALCCWPYYLTTIEFVVSLTGVPPFPFLPISLPLSIIIRLKNISQINSLTPIQDLQFLTTRPLCLFVVSFLSLLLPNIPSFFFSLCIYISL